MQDSETIEIPLSKLRLVLMLLACLGFVAAGVFFVTSPNKVVSPIARSVMMIFIVGCIGILFFGFAGITIIKRLFDKAPGIVISESGITDNSGGIPAGFVPWSDIIAVKKLEVGHQRFVNLVVKNRKEYIRRQKNVIKRKFMQKNFTVYGGIGISPNSLDIKFEDLQKIIEKGFYDFNAKGK
jgi:hypothetical protein